MDTENSNTSFYSGNELIKIGFKNFGNNVLLSRKASIYNAKKMEIGDNVRIDDFCILSGNIRIGSYVHIAAYTALYGEGEIELHDFSGLSSRVSLYSVTDNYNGEALTGPCIPMEYRKLEVGRIELKKHSLVGASSVILPNTILNEGTTIGALSLVKGIFPEWSIFAGIPAKFRKKRNNMAIKLYEESVLNLK